MNWTVIVAEAAQKQLAKFPAKDQDKIAAALLAMSSDPLSGDIVKPEGEQNRWRRRVGSYRIFFSVEKVARIVAIGAILRRTSKTYQGASKRRAAFVSSS
jgi:mRNA-degrading endonuclease RelE of RelBE toxin-antitoxin system